MGREKIKHHLWKALTDFTDVIDQHDRQLAADIVANSFIAGGAIASLVMGEPVHDYDLYFTDVSTCQRLVDMLVNTWNAIPDHAGRNIEHYQVHSMEEEPDKLNMKNNPIIKDPVKDTTPLYAPICFTGNAITLNGGIQIITRFIGSPEEITKRFDFAHTQCYYRCPGDTLVMPTKALESMATNELIYTGSDYPLSSIIRTKKYIQRGWKVNAGQYLKMALQLHALDFTKREVLAEQLMGVDLEYYGELVNTIRKMESTQDKSATFPWEPKHPDFYDPFHGDDQDLIGRVILDIVSELWD